MKTGIVGLSLLASVQLRAWKTTVSPTHLGFCVWCLCFQGVAPPVHGVEQSSPSGKAKPSEDGPYATSLKLPREDYSVALTKAILKEDSIGDLQMKVSLVPDAYRYYMAREINALREKNLAGRELDNALRSLHGKYKSFKGQPLFLVSMAREGKDSCFFLQDELKKHVSLHTSKPRDTRDFGLDDVRPILKKDKWMIFETAPEHRQVLNRVRRPGYERELYPFSKLDFTVVGILRQDKTEAGLMLTIGGLVANDGGKKGGRGIHGGKKQLSCKDFKYLVCESKSFRFERSEWKIPPAPREFEEILARMEKR